MTRYTGIIEKYRKYLPVEPNDSIIALGEGNTPLIKLHNIADILKKNINVYVKYEGLNPTGSFKDRGMCLAVSKAVSAGSKAIICASTGNTSAAAAAYASRAGIKSFVIIPDGNIAMGKLAQALISGAVVIKIKGNFDEGMQFVKDIIKIEKKLSVVNSVNPYRIQGQKTISFEIIDELGNAPDYHCLPVGNAGNITAHWMGYQEFHKLGKSLTTPIMLGYQAEGSAPFIHRKPINNPETIATAIRIGNPQSYELALKVEKESNGWFMSQTDEQILVAQKLLTQQEGIFCEPASAISLAGAMHDIKIGKIPEGSNIICTLTGHGLKDPDTAIKQSADSPVVTVNANLQEVTDAIMSHL